MSVSSSAPISHLPGGGAALWSDELPLPSPVLAPKPGSPVRLSRHVAEHSSLSLDQLRDRVSIVDRVRARMSVTGAGAGSSSGHRTAAPRGSAAMAGDGRAGDDAFSASLVPDWSIPPSRPLDATALVAPGPLDVYDDTGIKRFVAAYKQVVRVCFRAGLGTG